MKLRYPKTREEAAELKVALDKIGYHPLDQINKYDDGARSYHLGSGRNGKRGRELFRNQPDNIKELAHQFLNRLLVKHKAKLEAKSWPARNGYYGILCGTAVTMAKKKLGLVMPDKERRGLGNKAALRKSILKTFLGLQEPLSKIGGYKTSRKAHAQKYNPNPSPSQVVQGDLTGV